MAKFIPLQGHTVSHLAEFCRNMFNSVNNLSFGAVGEQGNMGGILCNATAVTANTDVAVKHNLNRVPQGYIVSGTSVAAHIFTGTATWTQTNIYLQSNTENTKFTVFVF